MNDTELRRAYDALLKARSSDGAQGQVSLERMLALVEGRGTEAERVATLDAVMADPVSARELALLRAVAANRPRQAWPRWWMTIPVLAAAAALLVVTTPALRDFVGVSRSEPMRDQSNGPALISPTEEALPRDSRTFRWHPVAGARGYSLEILTATGTPIFTTRTTDTTVTLAADVQLAPGVEHRWWVAGELPDGTQRRSPFRRLLVRAR